MHALGEEQRSFARDATCHAREVWFYTQGRGLYPGKSPTPLRKSLVILEGREGNPL